MFGEASGFTIQDLNGTDNLVGVVANGDAEDTMSFEAGLSVEFGVEACIGVDIIAVDGFAG